METTSGRTAGGDRPGAPRLVTGLGCSSCGGVLEAREGWTNLVCRYCGAAMMVAGQAGAARYMVLERVDRARAEETLRRWLREGIRKAPGLGREARMQEAFLAWFPFVRSRFDVVGWVLGTVRRKSGNTTVNDPREIEVQRSFDATRPAADMSEFGVSRVNLSGDALAPLEEETLRARGMVFRPRLEPEEAARAMIEVGMQASRASASLHRVTFSWLRAVRRRTALIYYPLWVFRYVFRGRTYQALVDAEDGALAYGQAPANPFVRALRMVLAVAGACFVGSTLIQTQACAGGSEDEGGGLMILALAFVLTVWWGYRQFRYGSVIEEGTGLSLPEDRVRAFVAKALERKT